MYRSDKKGLLGTVFIVIIVGVVVAMFILIYLIKSSTHLTVNLNTHLLVDDSGGWAVSLMGAENPIRPNIESLGIFASSGDKAIVQNDFDWIKGAIAYQNTAAYKVKRSIKIKDVEIGNPPTENDLSVFVIPVPGGGTSELMVRSSKGL